MDKKIQHIIAFTSGCKNDSKKICSYCKNDPCKRSYMCKKRKQVETKLKNKKYVSLNHIQNIRQNL